LNGGYLQDDLNPTISGGSDLSDEGYALATSRSLPTLRTAKKSLFPNSHGNQIKSMGESSAMGATSAMGGCQSWMGGGGSSMHGGNSIFAPTQSAFALSPYTRTMSMVSLDEATSPASFLSNAYALAPNQQTPGAQFPCSISSLQVLLIRVEVVARLGPV
jgi:hypothetical protein